MKALSRKLLRDIKTLRVQILTMAILVACGVAVLVASWSSYLSLQNAKDNYYEKYRFADLFAEFVRAPQSLVRTVQSISGVELAEGRLVEEALLDMPQQSEPALGRVISFDQTSLINQIYLRQGRLPERGTTLEVLVHESFARAHSLKAGSTFYLTIKGQKKQVTVSGIGISPEYVYALSPLAPFPDDLHFGILWMNSEELAQLANMQGAINSLVIRLTPQTQTDEVKVPLDNLLSPYGGLGSYDRDQQISHLFVQDEIRQQKSMSSIVPGIFIMVAAFILHTVMSRLVGLHRTQIAALKSLGYTSQSLAWHYWKLVTIILILGIIPAVILAQGIGQWYAYLYQRYFHFPKIDFSLSSESLIIGILAGLIPGWLASLLSLADVFSLNPAEAMRPPSPAPFSKIFFERWKHLKPKTILSKMVWRNILARPWRTQLTVLGISAATAILINGSFWSDIIDYVIERQFQQINRQDLAIHLLHPRGLEALSEIRRISGVIMIEKTRSTAVRMKFRNFTKDTAVFSADDQVSLNRILNRQGLPLKVPEGEVLLSQYFEKKYGIKKGDIIHLEVFDKTSPGFEVSVGGFVDDIVGSAVYANETDLHKWLRETSGFTTVYAKIDPTQSESIYVRLKQMPEVASVGVKNLLYKSFTATLSDMILTFTFILVLFAITIAGAVLFNMARISFSEKSWELASMKIMGFDDPDVFHVLFLEMGIYVVISLLPGLLLGYGLSFLSTQWIHTDTFAFPLVIDIKTYALALVVIVITYFVTGFFLYRKVQTLNMTEALKARE